MGVPMSVTCTVFGCEKAPRWASIVFSECCKGSEGDDLNSFHSVDLIVYIEHVLLQSVEPAAEV